MSNILAYAVFAKKILYMYVDLGIYFRYVGNTVRHRPSITALLFVRLSITIHPFCPSVTVHPSITISPSVHPSHASIRPSVHHRLSTTSLSVYPSPSVCHRPSITNALNSLFQRVRSLQRKKWQTLY